MSLFPFFLGCSELFQGGAAVQGQQGANGVAESFHASSYSNIRDLARLTLWIAAGNTCEAGYFPFHPPR